MKRITLALFVGAFLLFGGATDAMSQQFTGGMRGTVSDAQGIIPGVTVILTNEGTTVARDTITNEVGEYAFPAVPPATYSVRTSLPGYKTFERRGITIGTQQFLTIDLLLEVGTVEEEITVTADAPLIETSNASVGDNLDREILESLPAPGRAAFLIAVTIPTVMPVGDPQFNRQQDQTNASRISLGGGGIRANNYLLDGVPITELVGRAVLNPSIEALSDVKVQVHTYDAEMGRTGGGVFNTTGRIGTNEFHGTGFFQTRPVWGQNENFFNEEAGLSKEESGLADAYYRLGGGGAGGPIWQNRTFFWTAYEGYRSLTTRNVSETWPSIPQRTGDFSNSTLAGVPVQIWNPFCREGANARCPATGSGSLATNGLFTNAIIPQDHPAASPVAFAIAQFWPTSTGAGLGFTANDDGLPNAIGTSIPIDRADMWSFKAEHKFTDNWSLSGMYIYNATDEPSNTFIWPEANADENFFNRGDAWFLKRRPHVLVFNNTNILNDTTVMTVRYGWTTWLDNTGPGNFPGGAASLGFAPSFTDAIHPAGKTLFPGIRFDSEDYHDVGKNLGNGGRRWKAPFAINVALSKLWGSHTFKVGGDARRLGVEVGSREDLAGRFDFNQNFTRGPGGIGGHEFASFLVGAPSEGLADFNDGQLDVYTRYFSGYFQDDWRINSRVTVNYGVRVEKEDGLRETQNRFTVAFDENAVSPLDALVPASARAGTPLAGRTIMGGVVFAGVGGAPTQQGDLAAARVSPRVGLTYSIDDSTVVRGGYGLFYAPWNFDASDHGQIGFTRATALNQISNDATGVPITVLDDPFPNGFQTPLGSQAGLLTGTGTSFQVVDQNKGDAKVHQYSIDLQRQLPGNMAITVGYTGATGRDIGYCGSNGDCEININQINPAVALAAAPAGGGRWDPVLLQSNVPNPFFGIPEAGEFANRETIAFGQLLRPFPQFDNVNQLERTDGGRRQYHALVFKLDKRTTNWFGGRFSYTFSSLKSNQFGESSSFEGRTSDPENNFDLDAEYDNDIFSSPHRIILAPIIRIPGPGEDRPLANALFGGWMVSAIVEMVSGSPSTARMESGISGSNLGLFGGRQRPNLVGDASTSGSDTDRVASFGQTTVRYFDADAYQNPGPGRFGNASRTNSDARFQFRKNLDLVIAKDTDVGGGAVAQIRFEILNLTNTPKFRRWGTDVGTSSFGRVRDQAGFMRIWQISFRLSY